MFGLAITDGCCSYTVTVFCPCDHGAVDITSVVSVTSYRRLRNERNFLV